ncbi:MAG: Restriction endonuclease BglII [Candidatus Latescibacteria bacterium ADurb.Bin168]|nr:MAG: Restriction endonuclease BglII [Candidatus Latescibacteria bacterium ADurb.Bin168]
MQVQKKLFHCGDILLASMNTEIGEVLAAVHAVEWRDSFEYAKEGKVYRHQAGYNLALAVEFKTMGWDSQPVLRTDPKLIGDFRKGLVFVEIQFGNSATLYRDFYKFQYGLANGLLSLAVLVIPSNPVQFFPTRRRSVQNMADFGLADRCLSVLPVNVPTLLPGLLPAV